MVDIIVMRGEGDYQGDDITEPLASEVIVARALGQSKIDDSEPVDEIQLSAPYTPSLRVGMTLNVQDAWGAPAYQGKITRVRHPSTTNANGSIRISTEITLRRPRASR